jgi:hypothetical protein
MLPFIISHLKKLSAMYLYDQLEFSVINESNKILFIYNFAEITEHACEICEDIAWSTGAAGGRQP